MGNNLLALGVVGGVVLLAVFAAWALAGWYARRGALRLSAACGRGWDRVADFGGRVVEAFEARNWAPAAVRA